MTKEQLGKMRDEVAGKMGEVGERLTGMTVESGLSALERCCPEVVILWGLYTPADLQAVFE